MNRLNKLNKIKLIVATLFFTATTASAEFSSSTLSYLYGTDEDESVVQLKIQCAF